MAESSAIEWTDATVNFWWGCTKVGPGCDHCYAEAWNNFRGNRQWGAGAPRRPIASAASTIRKLNRDHAKFFAANGRRRRVFIQSMSDTFDNEVDQAWRISAFAEIELAQQLDIQLLTKRIPNVAKMVPAAWCAGFWPRHVGLMITVVNQEETDRDVPRLIELKRQFDIPWVGLSCEPLLGPIDISPYMWPVCGWWTGPYNSYAEAKAAGADCGLKRQALVWAGRTFLDWVIVGGESGHHARAIDPVAVRLLRDQCANAGTPFLFKQWGEYEPTSDANGPYMMWSGKKAAGRLLDGRTHDEFPRTAA